MKILSAAEIREWDQFTIEQEPVSSLDLMERAAVKCTEWLLEHFGDAPSFGIFCGKGNNGGDGLAVARMLLEKGFPVSVHILEFGHKGTEDFQTNLARLHKLTNTGISFIQTTENFHPFPPGQVIIDALFGSGLNRPLEGVTAALVEHINQSGHQVVSVDIPSGLFTDRSSKGAVAVTARYTLSFQCYKPAFLFPENDPYIGEVQLLDIGLHPAYYRALPSRFELTDDALIHSIYTARKRFAHKGDFGHALLVAGSYGRMGAAVLAASACLRGGAGLVTAHVPSCGYMVLQTAVPEAMLLTDFNSSFCTKLETDLSRFDAIGAGPGLGTAAETKMMLRELLDAYRGPLVLDADALNCMAAQKDLLSLVPAGSILTPHPKEFERLFGESANDAERILLALEKAGELGCIILLKGHHSLIATPDGKGFFNSTGNPGMATAGSGDVLTGLLTALLAQGYSSSEAAILGTYLHGLAGDIAAKTVSEEALVAGDIISFLGQAYLRLRV